MSLEHLAQPERLDNGVNVASVVKEDNLEVKAEQVKEVNLVVLEQPVNLEDQDHRDSKVHGVNKANVEKQESVARLEHQDKQVLFDSWYVSVK